jgi:CTP synthase
MGATMRLGEKLCLIKPNTLAERAYKKSEVGERHRHRYEFNNQYLEEFQQAGAIFSGASKENLMEIFELPQKQTNTPNTSDTSNTSKITNTSNTSQTTHPFFISSQFHPEFTSRLENPSPLFLEFSRACLESKKK